MMDYNLPLYSLIIFLLSILLGLGIAMFIKPFLHILLLKKTL